jgi:hypothetical protein
VIVLYLAGGLIGALVVAGLILAALGSRLPKEHEAVVSARFSRPADEVFARIADPAGYPGWNPAVKKVERLPDAAGREAWLVHDKNGKLPSVVLERTPPSATAPGRFVTEIADPELPFGGRWIWEIAPDGTVSITEDGEVRNPLFRFLARHVFGYTATAEATLRALGKSLGEDTQPRIDESGR